MPEPTVVIRAATPADVPALLRLVRGLAAHQGHAGDVIANEELYAAALFPTDGAAPTVCAHVAELDGAVVGMAVWYLTFSTWLGRNGIHLEDLYVDPHVRGRGVGRALLAELARVCVERGYPRLEWWVLDTNTSALEFYAALGAEHLDDVLTHRLSGDSLGAVSDSGYR